MNCLRGQRNATGDNRQYAAAVRKFSLTMHFHSPRAFRYLREKFDNKLPHPSTLRKWFANSGINGEPGILSDAMNTLKSLADKMRQTGKQIVVSLCLDETSMKYNVQWLHEQKKFVGFVTEPKADGSFPIAKNVMVFMVTVLGENVSIPVAYYFVASLDGVERANQLSRMLTELHKIKVRIAIVTFDGLKANFSMCE